MNRRLLLRPALPLALVSALLAFALDAATEPAAARQTADKVTQGSLRAFDADGKPAGECPLKHTAVRAEVSGFISRVTVTQEFENPFADKIEAVYVFPLPQAAAVDDMLMTVGGRTIRAKIMRREQAQAVYEEARARGHVASLLDQERPNIFTQSVANILPGQSVKVTISYVETLKYEAGSYEWSFPMAVGARYLSSGAASSEKPTIVHPNGVEDGQPQDDARQQSDAGAGSLESSSEPTPAPAATGAPGASRVNPARVPPGMRAGHDISIEVSLDAGVPLEAVASATHEIDVERRGAAGALVRLKGGAAIPNKDFTLKYDVAGGRVEDALLTHASTRGRFFTLILQPPERVAPAQVVPKELVFVLDTSGSMSGFPLEKAKETMALALGGLNPQDTFNLITFSGDTSILFPAPVPATPANLAAARKFLDSRAGGGGTEMMKAIRAALDPSDAADHVRVVCFMTDGQVGGDFEIIGEVKKHPNARVFSMGFGYSPNRFLLDKMAEVGRGEVEYVTDNDDGSAAARRFHERVRDPLLTDISVEWEGLAVSDTYPAVVPDLFGAKPVVVVGRYERGGTGRVRLRGKAAGGDFVRDVSVTLPEADDAHDVLATLWARRRVDELMGRDMIAMRSEDPATAPLREEVARLGLDFRLLTQFTSFVAVEERIVTDGGDPRRVDVPAESPPSPYANGVGVAAETVTVQASQASLAVNYSTMSTVVETRIAELPLNGRSSLSLVTVTPGAAPASSGGQGGVSFNGQRARSNSFQIDGVSANVDVTQGGRGAGGYASGAAPGFGAGGGASGAAPASATQEMIVNTESDEAQFGRAAGAHVNVITRSGTNALRGSVFGYFGHEALDANDWFANREGFGRPAHRLADFGGTLGGPFRKDKTFFFASYEGQRLRRPAFTITEVPSLAARLAAPDSVRAFLEAFPLPTGAARADGFAEFAAPHSTPARLDSFVLRVDHVATDRLSLNARYGAAGSSSDERAAFGTTPNTLSRVRSLAQTLTGTLNYLPSTSSAVEVRANYSRVRARGSLLLDGFGGAFGPGTDAETGALTTLLTRPGGSFVFDLGGRGAALARADEAESLQRQLNLVGLFNFVSGTHTFKLGADYRRLTPAVGLRANERDFYFDGVAGALASTVARDAAFTHAGDSRPVFDDFAAYAQDEWKVSHKLTLNLGLRWELAPAPHAGGGASPAAVTQTEDPARLALAPEGTPLWETTFFNFAPRFGLSYQLSDDSGRETVARAGFGLFYDAGGAETGHAFADSYPFMLGGAAFGVPFTPGAAPAATTGAPLSAFDPHLKMPYTLRWHASIERALGGSQRLTAGYVGAAGRRLLLTRTLVDPTPDFSLARLTTNGGASDYHSARLQFGGRVRNALEALASYTFAKSLDDFSEDAPARALLRGDAERGPSDFDVRHTLSGYASYKLPAPFRRGVGNSLSRNWALDAVFNARSARPLNVVYGFPVAHGFAFLRPDLAGGVSPYVSDREAPGGWRLNPLAFVVPGGSRQGTLGRNALRGFPFYRLDVALRRQFNFGDEVNLQLRAEAFNLLNHPNFDDPVGTLALVGAPGPGSALRPYTYFGRSLSARGFGEWGAQAGGFGPLYAAGGARTVQLSLKLSF
ncbi:MAG TPA: VIT domain-containing protein [Pyrinomonadaceae bacterium]|jgi:Ca-activated chloride channel family protein